MHSHINNPGFEVFMIRRPTIKLAEPEHHTTLMLALLVFVLVIKLYSMFSFPLLDDEIYYYIWSQKFALGYPEHGPFLPWIYSFSRIWFPETPFFIRLPNFILMLLLNVYLLLFFRNGILSNLLYLAFCCFMHFQAPLL